MVPNVAQTAETVAHAIASAERLIDDARWLHNEAYLPRGRDPDRPTWSVPIDPTNADAVPGERDDLGLATDSVLRRYRQSAQLVAEAVRLGYDATSLAHGREPATAVVMVPTGNDYPTYVGLAVRLLARIEGEGIEALGDRARMTVWSSANMLLRAHVELRAAMPNPERLKDPPADRRCRTCQAPHIEGLTDRSECSTCRSYRSRHGGETRPFRRNAAALAAKGRRRERGEDHGSEDGGVQAGSYRDGRWEAH